MKITKSVPYAAVIQSWLQAEWYLPLFDNVRVATPKILIESVETNDTQKNEQRLQLLLSIRYPIIDPLPADTVWHSASLDKEDIKRIYIVPSNDWETVSSGTYYPLKVMENLHLDDGHAKKINEIKDSLTNLDTRLVLVGTSIDSPLTILEGNHRAVALFANAIEKEQDNPILAEVFVGISPSMKDYIFHIEKYMVPA